jgi:curved DNA-binding protein CbpA
MENYYQILGVSRQATNHEIRSAYRRLARQYHPDLHPNDLDNLRKIQDINLAYETLSDATKRTLYDDSLPVMDHPGSSTSPWPQRPAQSGWDGVDERPADEHWQESRSPFGEESGDFQPRQRTGTAFYNTETAEHVIRQLKLGMERSDLIYEVCIIAGLDWYEADAFVRQVETELDSAEPTWRLHIKRAWKVPWEGVLRYAVLSVLVAAALLYLVLAVYSNSQPITWNLALQEKPAIEQRMWRQTHRVEAGKSVQIDYVVTMTHGTLDIYFTKGLPFIKEDAVAFLTYEQRRSLSASAHATWTIPVLESGFYDLEVVAKDFEGAFRVVWR